MSRDRIINLIGASGSGKTALAKELEKLDFNIIQSYTSRKPRYENEWGHEFIDEFVGMDNENISFIYKGKKRTEKFIAYFNHYRSHEHYFATEDQYLGKGTSIYIVDSLGSKQVKKIVKDIDVITIYLVADEDTRKERLLDSRDKEEVSTRLKRDRELFKRVSCDYVINVNRNLDDVLNDMLLILQEESQDGGLSRTHHL